MPSTWFDEFHSWILFWTQVSEDESVVSILLFRRDPFVKRMNVQACLLLQILFVHLKEPRRESWYLRFTISEVFAPRRKPSNTVSLQIHVSPSARSACNEERPLWGKVVCTFDNETRAIKRTFLSPFMALAGQSKWCHGKTNIHSGTYRSTLHAPAPKPNSIMIHVNAMFFVLCCLHACIEK